MYADIFFLITSIASFVFLSVTIIAGYYVILIVRDVREITQKVRNASEEISHDFENMRAHIKQEGSRVASFATSIFSFFGKSHASSGKGSSSKKRIKKVVIE